MLAAVEKGFRIGNLERGQSVQKRLFLSVTNSFRGAFVVDCRGRPKDRVTSLKKIPSERLNFREVVRADQH